MQHDSRGKCSRREFIIDQAHNQVATLSLRIVDRKHPQACLHGPGHSGAGLNRRGVTCADAIHEKRQTINLHDDIRVQSDALKDDA